VSTEENLLLKLGVLVIDMVKDTFVKGYPIAPYARELIPVINRLTRWARNLNIPVIFACDSFLKNDFIFQGRMKPHSLRGTDGAMVTEELERSGADIFLPKRRFSAFFKTDLDQSLRMWGVDTVAIAGVSTNVCVLSTALDALSNDFNAIIVADACAAQSQIVHAATLNNYQNTPLYPLFRILNCDELIQLHF
jgi:nicotinamidase-related amidase